MEPLSGLTTFTTTTGTSLNSSLMRGDGYGTSAEFIRSQGSSEPVSG